MEHVGDGELLARSEFKKSLVCVICLANAESSHGSSPLFVCIWSYFGGPVSLDDEEVLPLGFLFDILEVSIKYLNMFIIIFDVGA